MITACLKADGSWGHGCLASTRPWVQTPEQGKKKTDGTNSDNSVKWENC
jgi:hypothetical protein